MKLMKYEEWVQSIHQADGLTQELENAIRRDAVSFIIAFGNNTELKTSTIAKAIYIFHQYSKVRSFKKFDYLLCAATCIFITSKFEDKPLKLDALTRTYVRMHLIYQRKRKINPIGTKNIDPVDLLLEGSKEFKADQVAMSLLKDRFKSTESNVLSEIGYDLDIDLPYTYLNALEETGAMLDESFLEAVMCIINQSWRTTLCLYFEPKMIALGALKLAQSQGGFSIKNPKHVSSWTKLFGEIAEEEIEEVMKYLKELV